MDLLTELQRTAEAFRTKAAKAKETFRDAPNQFAVTLAIQTLETCAEDLESLIWTAKMEARNAP